MRPSPLLWSVDSVPCNAAAHVRISAGIRDLISILGLGVSPLFVFYTVLYLEEALTFWWPQIQGDPPLFTCLMFWYNVSSSPTSILSIREVDLISPGGKVLQGLRVNNLNLNLVRGTAVPESQDRLKGLLPDGSTGGLVVWKALYLNLNFNFLNRILLLLISCRYPIVLTRLGGPRSRSYTTRKISRV